MSEILFIIHNYASDSDTLKSENKFVIGKLVDNCVIWNLNVLSDVSKIINKNFKFILSKDVNNITEVNFLNTKFQGILVNLNFGEKYIKSNSTVSFQFGDDQNLDLPALEDLIKKNFTTKTFDFSSGNYGYCMGKGSKMYIFNLN